MNNVFVNSILAITGMAVVIALGILNLVSTPSHGMALGLVGLVFSIVLLGVLTVLAFRKCCERSLSAVGKRQSPFQE